MARSLSSATNLLDATSGHVIIDESPSEMLLEERPKDAAEDELLSVTCRSSDLEVGGVTFNLGHPPSRAGSRDTVVHIEDESHGIYLILYFTFWLEL